MQRSICCQCRTFKVLKHIFFGLLRADSDELIGYSLLQWFVISSLKCLLHFHWMSMNQQCFFPKTWSFRKKTSSGTHDWHLFVIRSAAKGWIEAQRQLGLFLLSRGMMHQEVPLLSCTPNFFGVRGVGGFLKRSGVDDFGILGMKTWKKRCFLVCQISQFDLFFCWWSEDSAVVMGVTFFLAFTTVLVMLAIYKASVPAYFWLNTNPYLTWVNPWYDTSQESNLPSQPAKVRYDKISLKSLIAPSSQPGEGDVVWGS